MAVTVIMSYFQQLYPLFLRESLRLIWAVQVAWWCLDEKCTWISCWKPSKDERIGRQKELLYELPSYSLCFVSIYWRIVL